MSEPHNDTLVLHRKCLLRILPPLRRDNLKRTNVRSGCRQREPEKPPHKLHQLLGHLSQRHATMEPCALTRLPHDPDSDHERRTTM